MWRITIVKPHTVDSVRVQLFHLLEVDDVVGLWLLDGVHIFTLGLRYKGFVRGLGTM